MMERTKLTDQEWETFLKLADRLGIDVWALQDTPVRFSEMESAGHRLGRAVGRMATERLTLLRAERLTEPQCCPTCGVTSPIVYEERTMETLDGPIVLTEPVCHCSACRRDFFPSAS